MSFITPKEVLHSISLSPGMVIADFGSGVGHYILPASQMVGDRGKVYALDVQKNLLEAIKNSAERAHQGNVEIIWADLEAPRGSRLADKIVDKVIISNLLFQISSDKRMAVITEAHRILKNGGEVALVDWADASPLGPSALQRLSKEEAVKLFESGWFQEDRIFPAGDHHYGIVFKKQV